MDLIVHITIARTPYLRPAGIEQIGSRGSIVVDFLD